MAKVKKKPKHSGTKIWRRQAHHRETGKYVRQRRRTSANKAKRIEAQIEYLQERLTYWRTQ